MNNNNNFYDPIYDGRRTLVPIDRFPDGKTKAVIPGRTSLKVIGMGKVIELNGKLYVEFPKWKAERF